MFEKLFKDAVVITSKENNISSHVYTNLLLYVELLNIMSVDSCDDDFFRNLKPSTVLFIEHHVFENSEFYSLVISSEHPFLVLIPHANVVQWEGVSSDKYLGFIINEAGKEHYLNVLKTGKKLLSQLQAASNSVISYFKSFMEMPSLVLITDYENGKILDANHLFCKITGYSREELSGKTTIDLEIWRDTDERERFYALLYKDGYVKSYPATLISKRIGLRNALLSSSIVEFGSTKAVVTVITDYSERKKIEEKLYDQQNVVKTILESTLAGYWDWDIIKNTEYYSPAFKKMFGYEDNEFLNLPESWKKIIHPDDLPIVMENYRQHVKSHGKIPFINEVRYFHKTGSVIWVICSGTVMEWDENNKPIRMVGCHIDITDKKMAEENLRISEGYNKVLFESSVTPLVLMDGQSYRFVDCNDAAVKVYGLKNKDEALTKTPIDVSAKYQYDGELSREAAPKYIKNALEKGEVSFEWRHQRKDGTIWDAEVHLVPFMYSGKVMLQFSLFDITDRKQETLRLQQAHATYQGILDSISEAVYIQDETGKFLDVNKTVERFYGYSKEEFIGKTPEFLSASDKNNNAYIEECLKKAFQGIPQRFEFWGARKDGSVFPKEVSVSKGDYFGQDVLIAVARDISERKQAIDAMLEQERQLKEATKLFEALFDAIPDIIGIQDTNRRVLRYNAAGYALLGFNQNEVYGKKCYELMGRVSPCEICATAKVFMTGKVEIAEKYVPELKKWFEARSYPLFDDNGKISMVVEHLRDITVHKHAEEERSKLQNQLQQAMKMEALGRLAGGVAHDFNNLLTAIIGNATLASFLVKDSETLTKKMSEIKKAAESAASLTKQLLAFSRKQMVEPKLISLNNLIERIMPMLKRLINENITINYEPEETNELNVQVDPSQFEQILINLVVNARDAMPKGGDIYITTKQIDPDEDYYTTHTYMKRGVYCCLSIRDNGIGISKEHMKHIFEPFFTTKSMGRGVGLGLATIYGAVKQANGFIEVISEEHKGTEFQIFLPYVQGTLVEMSVEEDTTDIVGGNETILLVEDEPAVRSFVEHFLSSIGYKVLSASNAEHAIDVARNMSGKIDLLFTDVVMPGMNGRELAHYLFDAIGLNCVLYASGYTRDVIASQGVIDEGLDFIEKPYSPHALAKKIKMILELKTKNDCDRSE